MKKYRRKKYLIDRPFQLKLLVMVISLLLIHTILVLAAVFLPTALVLYSNLPLERKNDAAKSILLFHKTIWPGIVAVIALFGYVSIFFSHKIAGPIYRIKMALREMAAGNYSNRITLRKGDELVDVAEHINALSEIINTSKTALNLNHGSVIEALAELKRELSAATPDKEAISALFEKIEAGNSEVSSILTTGR